MHYNLLRLRDGRVVRAGLASHDDLATLCLQVADALRRELHLLPAEPQWLGALPASVEARAAYYQGLAALAEGRSGTAVSLLEQASADPQAGARVLLSLASAYRSSGQLGSAQQTFAQVLREPLAFEAGERLRIEAEAAMAEHRILDAVAALEALHRLLPEDRQVMLALVDARLQARKREAAAELLERLAATDVSQDPRWLLLRARLAQAEGNHTGAADYASLANQLASERGWDELAVSAALERAQAWRASGQLQIARESLQSLADQPLRNALAAEIHGQLGSLLRDIGEFGSARDALQRAEAGYAELGNLAGVLRMRIEQHIIHSEQGHNSESYRALQELATELLALDDAVLLARWQNTLGVQALRNGDVSAAEDHLQQTVRYAQRARLAALEAGAYSNLGQVLAGRGRHEEAKAVWEQALQVFREQDDLLGQGITLSNLAAVASIQGQLTRSRDLNQQALDLLRKVDATQHQARTAFNLGLASERAGMLAEAAALFEEALQLYRDGMAGDPVLSVTTALLRVRLQQARLDDARTLLDAVEEELNSSRNPLARSQVLSQSVHLAILQGDFRAARLRAAEVVELRREVSRPVWQTLAELDQLSVDVAAGAFGESQRARAERLAELLQRQDDPRGQVRALIMEAEQLIALQRPLEARDRIDLGYNNLTTQPDTALSLELDRLRILSSAEPAQAHVERLRLLADEAGRLGYRVLELRLRLKLSPDDPQLQAAAKQAGLLGLL